MNHLKRQRVPKNWNIPRKGSVFVMKPSFNLKSSVPLTIVLRDVLGIACTKREVKKAIHEKNILINNKLARSEKDSCSLFDIISIVPSKKFYQITLKNNGKFNVSEIKEEDSTKKISKIINKKILKDKKTQINLSDGRNFLSEIKCDIGDSAVIGFESEKSSSKILKCLPMKEKSKAIAFAGKHSGKMGIIKDINKKDKIAKLDIGNEDVSISTKQIMVIEK